MLKKGALTLLLSLSSGIAVSQEETAADANIGFVVSDKYKEADKRPEAPAPKSEKKEDKPIVLEMGNTIVLNDAFDGGTVAKVLKDAMDKHYKLRAGEPMYLFLDTPGGEIVSGQHLISALKGLGREVKTVTSFSASMGFMTTQALGERLIMRDGILMSHRAAGGVSGQFNGELETRLTFWKKYIGLLNETAAKRIGITVDELEAKHKDEWWTVGEDAVKQHTADRVVDVRCGKTLTGIRKEEIKVLFFTIDVEFSNCPLIRAPLKVDLKKDAGVLIPFTMAKDFSDEQMKDYIDARFYNKERFLNDYIKTNKYLIYIQK